MCEVDEVAAACLTGLLGGLNGVTEDVFVGGTPSAAVVNGGYGKTEAYEH